MLIFFTFCSSRILKEMYHGFYKNIKQEKLFIFNNKKYCFNDIRIISEGSCDTEDRSNDAKNSALPSQE